MSSSGEFTVEFFELLAFDVASCTEFLLSGSSFLILASTSNKAGSVWIGIAANFKASAAVFCKLCADMALTGVLTGKSWTAMSFKCAAAMAAAAGS